jgi:iron complex outermembrane receptor protein
LNRQQAVLLPGFLGGGITSIANTPIVRGGHAIEASGFISLTWHIDDATELTGGFRHIENSKAGTLDVGGSRLAGATEKADEKPNVWNVSLSHHFTDDFMAYANVGTSWRLGPYFVGVFRPTTPNIDQFTKLDSEKSTSFELGSKATFFDKRLRVNAAVYHQDFDNYIYRGPNVWYVDLTARGPVPATFAFGSSVKAKVDGVELDTAFQATKHWNIGAAFSYAKGEIKNGVVACTDINGDGIPDSNGVSPTLTQLQGSLPAGEAVAACGVNIPSSTAPKWSATLQSEYDLPVTANMEAYLRGLLSYYPSNNQDTFNPYDNVSSYGLLNLFTGLRNSDGSWEVSIFAKNLTNTNKTLNTNASPATTSATQITAFGPPVTTTGVTFPSSYLNGVTLTPKREFGLNVRYAFGSR